MYDESCNLMYKMISKRFQYRKEILGLTNREIDPLSISDSLLSAITNGRRDPKRNPYLVPGGITPIIAESLKFDSPQVFLWGNEKEIEAYAQEMFTNLVKDTIKLADDKSRDELRFKLRSEMLSKMTDEPAEYDVNEEYRSIEDIVNEKMPPLSEPMELSERLISTLLDYIPFAKSCFFGEIAAMNVYGEEIISCYTEGKSYDDYDDSLSGAIDWFYGRVKDEFKTALRDNLYKLSATKKLNDRLYEFSRDTLVPLLEKAASSYPSGKEIYEMLMKHFIAIVNNSLPYLRASAENYDKIPEQKNPSWETLNDVAEADLEYADKIAEIQSREMIPLKKTKPWNPKMCDLKNA